MPGEPEHGTGAVVPGVTDADLALPEHDPHAPDVVAAFCLEELREAGPRSAPSDVKRGIRINTGRARSTTSRGSAKDPQPTRKGRS
jgi:hypothetical protein